MLKRFRSAITGRFVNATTAHRHPSTTVGEELELERLEGAELVRALTLTLGEIIRSPHYSHPGEPTVTYYHRPAELHDQAYRLVTAGRRFLRGYATGSPEEIAELESRAELTTFATPPEEEAPDAT